MSKYHRAFLIIVGFFVVFVFAFGSYLIWQFHYGVEALRTNFTYEEWKKASDVFAHSSDPGCVRGGMALDLINSGALINLKLSEIIEILGQPSNNSVREAHYELGQCSGFGWHNSVLAIYFFNGSVNELKIIKVHP